MLKLLANALSVIGGNQWIVEAIIDGTQPRSINRTRLLAAEMPIDWTEQEALFGLAA